MTSDKGLVGWRESSICHYSEKVLQCGMVLANEHFIQARAFHGSRPNASLQRVIKGIGALSMGALVCWLPRNCSEQGRYVRVGKSSLNAFMERIGHLHPISIYADKHVEAVI